MGLRETIWSKDPEKAVNHTGVKKQIGNTELSKPINTKAEK